MFFGEIIMVFRLMVITVYLICSPNFLSRLSWLGIYLSISSSCFLGRDRGCLCCTLLFFDLDGFLDFLWVWSCFLSGFSCEIPEFDLSSCVFDRKCEVDIVLSSILNMISPVSAFIVALWLIKNGCGCKLDSMPLIRYRDISSSNHILLIVGTLYFTWF